MKQTRTTNMRSRHIRLKLASFCILLTLAVCCVILTTNPGTWSNLSTWLHSSGNAHHPRDRLQLKSKNGENINEMASDGLYRDTVETNEEEPEKSNETDEREILHNKNCSDGQIYFSNEYVNCNGIIRDPDDDPNADSKTIGKDKEWKNIDDFLDELNVDIQPTKVMTTTTKATDNSPRHIFINCGIKLPTALDLFLDTYPNAEIYELFSFISDPSYSILYKKYSNHTFMYAEASHDNRTENEDKRNFGSNSETTQHIHYMDIASWILENTKTSDHVIMVLESDKEEQLIKHLVMSEAMNNIDKYYSACQLNGSEDHIKDIQALFETQNVTAQIWDSAEQTYSDYESVNPKRIPVPGGTISNCSKADNSEKFLLLLYSSEASVYALQTIKLLQTFAHSDHLPTWLFLPYEMFKFPPDSFDIDDLFRSFHLGLYYADDDKMATSFRNKATFVNRIFERQTMVLEFILAGKNANESVMEHVQERYNYKFITGGIDITHLSSKIKEQGIIDIADTGKSTGDILLINIDKIDSEYLALYSLRHFAPWLLSVKDCQW